MGFKQLATSLTIGMMAVVALPSLAGAVTDTITVTETDIARQELDDTEPTKAWVLRIRDTGTGSFIAGPAAPPIGKGSLELITSSSNDKVYLFNYENVGKKLADVTALSYETYRTQGMLQQVTAINIEVDVNGPTVDGGYTVLVFEPVYNPNQGEVVNEQWQAWDAYSGGNAIWWSSSDIPGVTAGNKYVSWKNIIAQYPNAEIIGGFGVNQGGGNEDLKAAVDKLSLSTAATSVTYNFETPQPVKATNKEDCENDGYKNFQTAYKNQGDCVSAVASNNRAEGDPEQAESFITSILRAIGF